MTLYQQLESAEDVQKAFADGRVVEVQSIDPPYAWWPALPTDGGLLRELLARNVHFRAAVPASVPGDHVEKLKALRAAAPHGSPEEAALDAAIALLAPTGEVGGVYAPCEFCGGRGFTDDGHVEWDGQVVSAPEGCVECDGRGTVPAAPVAAGEPSHAPDASRALMEKSIETLKRMSVDWRVKFCADERYGLSDYQCGQHDAVDDAMDSLDAFLAELQGRLERTPRPSASHAPDGEPTDEMVEAGERAVNALDPDEPLCLWLETAYRAMRAAAPSASHAGREAVAWVEAHKLERLRDGWSTTCYGPAWLESHRTDGMVLVPLFTRPPTGEPAAVGDGVRALVEKWRQSERVLRSEARGAYLADRYASIIARAEQYGRCANELEAALAAKAPQEAANQAPDAVRGLVDDAMVERAMAAMDKSLATYPGGDSHDSERKAMRAALTAALNPEDR